MQSRPRLANVSGVVVGPLPPALDGTDRDNELGLPTAPAPPRAAARLERSSTFSDTGEAEAATPLANGLEDADWMLVAAAVVVVVVIWLMLFCAGPPPMT